MSLIRLSESPVAAGPRLSSSSVAARRPHARVAALAALVALLAGCASSTHRAPVEDRSQPPPAAGAAGAAAATGAEAGADPAKALPGAENAGKPGYYTVKPGDTLIRIGLDSGQNWRDIARWNELANANVIEVGQVLRVVPPGVDPAIANATVAKPVAPAPRSDAQPLAPAASAASAPAAAGTATVAAAPGAPAAVSPPAPVDADGEPNWAWPARGSIVAAFDESRTKGISIAGKMGDPVYAAADGRVVYAGSGLRGYGNLIIVKHNATYLSAYAHNQALLVKEEQVVRRGQKIAEMGATDADRVQLHFEIRRQGKPVDPVKLLPAR